MKTSLLFLSIMFSFSLYAQQLDNFSIGAGYAQQVWYDFETGTKTKGTGTWDIAFSMRPNTDAAIWVSAKATLYEAVAPASDWTIPITVNVMDLIPQYGLDSTWSVGAFNRKGDNITDFGWGFYDSSTKNIEGEFIYVIKNSNGKYQKILIQKLEKDSAYYFKYADLDGANEKSVVIKKSNYKNKLLAYFSLTSNTAFDYEPALSTWDLTALRYVGLTADLAGNYQSYPLTGILQNPSVKVAKIIKRDTSSDSQIGLSYKSNINTIGSDWKFFNINTGWKVVDSTTYFVKNRNNKIFKLVFTKFDGNSTGNIFFKKEAIFSTSLANGTESLATFAVYPNPTSADNIKIIFEVSDLTQAVDFQLINLSGQVVYSKKNININLGFIAQELPALNIPAGLYFAKLIYGDKSLTQELIITE